MTEQRTVRVVQGGPILVEGPVSIELPDGSTLDSDRFMVAICTCRRSKNYPLCDTSHRRRLAKGQLNGPPREL
ncbi:CDGSH iron-sulfur domain-containing protein [Mycobacterium sp. 21AC1]|uniref:CDGSH iron-sulfur domain-containing protein n=1 Tax=[Mycobacterium] appelbergii TaxID=2939269 RepID=UPI0029393598|nr:CDGSH iron-sulfur domain-containing protein [Mycobacterium sp. 21AC1]MDV3126957.1 CDGSH iron-sulfur domain-containing protein [Mycobacterium sp. 21AC1]